MLQYCGNKTDVRKYLEERNNRSKKPHQLIIKNID